MTQKVKKGVRIKITRDRLYHICAPDQQARMPTSACNSYNVYGTVIQGSSGKRGWDIQFDVFSLENHTVKNVSRDKIVVLSDGDAEVEYDREVDLSDHPSTFLSPTQTEKQKQTQEEFLLMDDDDTAHARSFKYQWGKSASEAVDCKILADDETVNLGMPDVEGRKATSESHFDDETHLIGIFFQSIFPSIEGHAAKLDAYFPNDQADFYETVKHDRIVFHDPDDDDPDWQVRQCYTLLIAAASEIGNGVKNLWNRGPANRQREYTDFRRYVSENMFKAFKAAAHFCWCYSDYWYKDKRDLTWDIFLLMLSQFNERRQSFVSIILLMVDESMSGWRPKSTKTGGLPKLSWEPRRPVPLGTTFRNGTECTSDILMFQDIVQDAEVMKVKEYVGEKSSMPNGMEIPAHAAEVLRQIEGAKVVEGGWCGGDAWFGSMVTALEVKKRLCADSTWIIQGNHSFYPTAALHAVLKARFGSKTAGHWAIATTNIAGVEMLALAYDWVQRGVSYLLSTCGNIDVSSVAYRSACEDNFGNVDYKFLPRPQLAHFIFEYLPLIDEDNKQRQAILGLERKWQTKCCWTRLVVTMVGMSVVDMQRIYRSEKKTRNKVLCGQVFNEDATVIKFSDLLCGKLRMREQQKTNIMQHKSDGTDTLLSRIEKDGKTNLPVTVENE
jgi:hypothetical protein